MSRELAHHALRAERFADAVAALAGPLAAAPGDADLRSLRAYAHARLGHVTRMVVDLKVVAEDFDARERLLGAPWLAPHLTNPYLVLAFEADEALDFAADALYEADPEACLARLEPVWDSTRFPSTAAFLASVALAGIGRHGDARSHAERVTEQLPAFPDGWFNLGCALEELGRPEDAEDAYRRSVAVDPSFSSGWFNLGMLLRNAGLDPESLAAFAAGAAACPEEPLLAYKHAEGLALAGRPAQAVAELERAIALDPAVRDAIPESDIFPRELDQAALIRLAGR